MSVPVSKRRRRRRGAGVGRWLLRLAVAVAVFAVGVAVGQALEDRPEAGRPVTTFATIEPWTETGRATVTRTVTVAP
jgi:hypothetical protein